MIPQKLVFKKIRHKKSKIYTSRLVRICKALNCDILDEIKLQNDDSPDKPDGIEYSTNHRKSCKRFVGCQNFMYMIFYQQGGVEMDTYKFGAFIAKCRKERNMTQADLALKIQVTDKAVSRWERGASFR